MPNASTHVESLKPGRLVRIFAVLSVVFVGVLAVGPVRPYLAEWRSIQEQYNELAEKSGVSPIPIAIQQIWKPALSVTDRCVTCHVGMGNSTPLPDQALFRAHSPIPHDPKEFGCTVCHGGQGRATTQAAAHGFVSHWDEQMLPSEHLSAGCGTCHSSVPLVSRRELERGQLLVESLDCMSCHPMDKRGRGKASDLTYVGMKGYRPDWHQWHLDEQAKDTAGVWNASYGEISPENLALIDAFLKTRVGAPRIVAAQALAMERGCLGCHKVNGLGGDEGPVLDAIGRKPVGDLNFDRVPGERTFVNYMRRHLIDPAGVVPGSQMPPQVATAQEADLLTSYVLFLRTRQLPAAFLPKDRLRRELLEERPPPLDKDQLYAAYCSACHGPQGEGKSYGSIDVRFPAVGSPDFLDVASDGFIDMTLKHGRPGRKMPALGAPGGSLTAQDISALIAHLRSLTPAPPSWADVERASPDRALGQQTYEADCAACHGSAGEGTSLGSPLATPDSRARGKRQDTYKAVVNGVPKTAMPKYSIYDAGTLKALVDHVATLSPVPGSRANWRLGSGDASNGREVYQKACSGCHGAQGEGKSGPALSNAGFLKAATREYVAITIVRGRSGTPMPAFGRNSVGYPRLAPGEVLDIAAFIQPGVVGDTRKAE